MAMLAGVRIRTRLLGSAWAFTALVTFFSLMLSLISASESGRSIMRAGETGRLPSRLFSF
jgi:hypothetical protein